MWKSPKNLDQKFSCGKNRGQWAQDKVQIFLKKKNFEILHQNIKIAGVELDLLVLKKGVYSIVEVKTLSHPDCISFRLPLYQKNRLLKAQKALISQVDGPVALWLAFVNPKGKICILDSVSFHEEN